MRWRRFIASFGSGHGTIAGRPRCMIAPTQPSPHCTALHCIALHCTALHCIACNGVQRCNDATTRTPMSLHSHPASPNGCCAVPAHPSSTAPRPADDLLTCVRPGRDLDQQALPPPTSLRQGYLGPRKVTLLIRQCKSVHSDETPGHASVGGCRHKSRNRCDSETTPLAAAACQKRPHFVLMVAPGVGDGQ
jgi:hypothetical protein